MEYTAARLYLYTLVFLQTFSILLCASTYLNHGLQGNLESSVRSPVRNKFLPEIKQTIRMRKPRAASNMAARKSSQLETLCSVHTSNVLCTASQISANSGGSTPPLLSRRVKRSISTRDRLRTIDGDTLASVLTTSRHQNRSSRRGSSLESILLNDQSSTLEQRLIISQLSSYRSSSSSNPLADLELENILQAELQRNNHQRRTLSPPQRSSSSTSTTNPSSTTTDPTITTPTSSTEIPTNIRINTRNGESLSNQHQQRSGTSNAGNQCNTGRGAFCLHGGQCVYDSRLNVSDCV